MTQQGSTRTERYRGAKRNERRRSSRHQLFVVDRVIDTEGELAVAGFERNPLIITSASLDLNAHIHKLRRIQRNPSLPQSDGD